MKSFLFATLLAGALFLAPQSASAHQYDRDDSDYPLRYAAYVVHPIGIAVEYAVLRPIHWLVSLNKSTQIIFGHEKQPNETENYMAWE